jgi:hypothetical protein
MNRFHRWFCRAGQAKSAFSFRVIKTDLPVRAAC